MDQGAVVGAMVGASDGSRSNRRSDGCCHLQYIVLEYITTPLTSYNYDHHFVEMMFILCTADGHIYLMSVGVVI
jgi:hypothetical protein